MSRISDIVMEFQTSIADSNNPKYDIYKNSDTLPNFEEMLIIINECENENITRISEGISDKDVIEIDDKPRLLIEPVIEEKKTMFHESRILPLLMAFGMCCSAIVLTVSHYLRGFTWEIPAFLLVMSIIILIVEMRGIEK